MKKCLTIAGSDCSGGAGIQADLKTMTAHGVYGMSVITALTAQNTTGVYGVAEIEPEFVARQIDCVFDDIRPDAVKIGMVSSAAIIEVIAGGLKRHKAQSIVLDPVMVATSGSRLIAADAVAALTRELLPAATVITPNIPEAEVLCGFEISCREQMEEAARQISKMTRAAVAIKGGHLTDSADDLLYLDGRALWFESPRIANPNTHGTGCTLSSAIACNLAMGYDIPKAYRRAKEYVGGALSSMLDLGRGSGPLDHCFMINGGSKR